MSSQKIYGLLGYPVKHSLSPAMHNAAFQFLHIPAKYLLFEKKAEEVINFLRSLAKENISGFNVTIPHKEIIKDYLDSITEEATLIGAVNTVRVDNGRTIGHNTDGLGFLKHLMEVFPRSIYGQTVALLGAGGAARAVSYMLAAEEVGSINIFDIDKTRALALAEKIRGQFELANVSVADSLDALLDTNPDLLINATPVGMKETDPLLINENRLNSHTFVYDLIYKPVTTKLLMLAKNKGCAYTNGLGMLLYQGSLAFELWTGQKAPIEIMRDVLMAEIIK